MSNIIKMKKINNAPKVEEKQQIILECDSIDKDVGRVVHNFLKSQRRKKNVKVECTTIKKEPNAQEQPQPQPNQPIKIHMMKIECDTLNQDVDKAVRDFFRSSPPPNKKPRHAVEPEVNSSQIVREDSQQERQNMPSEESLEEPRLMICEMPPPTQSLE